MSGEINTTITGNITKDIRELNSAGAYGVSFTVAATKRRYNKQTGTMGDAGTVYMDCTAWGDIAQHIIRSLGKGSRVIVTGELEQHSYTDKQGNKRSSIQLRVHDIGPSLMWATAQVTKLQASSNGFMGSNRPQNGNYASQQNTYQNRPPQYNNTNGQQADQFGQLNGGYAPQTMQGTGQQTTDIWGRQQNQFTQPAPAPNPIPPVDNNVPEPEF